MKCSKLQILAFVAFVVSCGGDADDPHWQNFPVCVGGLTDEDSLEVVEWFNNSCGDVFEICDDSSDGIMVNFVDEFSDEHEGDEDAHGWCHTHYDSNGMQYADIEILNDIFDGGGMHYKSILAHELGHALGADHVEEGLMCSEVPNDDVDVMIDDFCNGWFAENYGGVE